MHDITVLGAKDKRGNYKNKISVSGNMYTTLLYAPTTDYYGQKIKVTNNPENIYKRHRKHIHIILYAEIVLTAEDYRVPRSLSVANRKILHRIIKEKNSQHGRGYC